MERRTLLATAAAGLAGTAITPAAAQPVADSAAGSAATLPKLGDPGELRGDMLYRKLGKTGETVSAIGLGGSHIAKKGIEEAESVRLIQAAIDRGITFMDNSWDYNEGAERDPDGQGAAEGGYRDKVFLMTKIDGRTKEAAAQQLDESLKRLQTDHIDLVQHHEVIRFEDPDRIFAPRAARWRPCSRPSRPARSATSASPATRTRSSTSTCSTSPREHGFHFDTVQMPLNVMDAHFRSFAQLVAAARWSSDGIGVLGMKSHGRRRDLLKSKTVTPIECLHYALNLPTSVVITGIDKPECWTRPCRRPRPSTRSATRRWPSSWPGRRTRPRPAPSSCSRPRPTSTPPPATPSGWATRAPR